MEHLVEDLKSAKGTCLVLNYIACMIYFICNLSLVYNVWVKCDLIYPFADILTMEKSEVESKIQEIFGEKVKIILFSVWS